MEHAYDIKLTVSSLSFHKSGNKRTSGLAVLAEEDDEGRLGNVTKLGLLHLPRPTSKYIL